MDVPPEPAVSDPAAAAAASVPCGQVVAHVQVQGQVLPVEWRILQHFSTVTQFLGAGDSQIDDEDGCTPSLSGTFCLPDWLSLQLWEQMLSYPGFKPDASRPSGTMPPAPECITFLSSCQQHLHDIARAAEFLGCASLVELASSACLLRLRPIIASVTDVAGLAADARVLQATTTPTPLPDEDLQLLFHPSDVELDAAWMEKVVRVPLEQFWPLVDQLVLADVVPAAGVVSGLIRALIWPCISQRREEEVMVVGLPGKGDSMEYLDLHVPSKVLQAFDARVLICSIRSHDQGWGGSPQDRNTYNGSWTFGTLEVNGEQHDGRLYTNLTASHVWQQHTKVLGAGSAAMRALASFAAGLRGQHEEEEGGEPECDGDGDSDADDDVGAHLTLTLHAFFKGWKNHVSDAQLECFFLPKGTAAVSSA